MKTVLLFRTSFSPQNKFEYKAMFDFAATWIKKSNCTIRHIGFDNGGFWQLVDGF